MGNIKKFEAELGNFKVIPIMIDFTGGEILYGFYDRNDSTSQCSKLKRDEMLEWVAAKIKSNEAFKPSRASIRALVNQESKTAKIDEEVADAELEKDYLTMLRRWRRGGWVPASFLEVEGTIQVFAFNFSEHDVETIYNLVEGKTETGIQPFSVEFGDVTVDLTKTYKKVISKGSSSGIDLSLCNVTPSAESIVDRVVAINDKPEDERPKNIAMLFHGLPGTGKTELAKYIGEQLGMTVIKKTYGEIQSKYIGEGEKNLRAAFEEAEAENAVLLIDELDSLTVKRETADKDWTKSMTNQFLTELDEFKGVFIGTTNHVNSMDSAILRRLHMKVEFKELTATQKKKAFKHFFPKLKVPTEIADVKYLTPGDFHAAKIKALYEPKIPNAKKVMELLREEIATKIKAIPALALKEAEEKKTPIGFMR